MILMQMDSKVLQARLCNHVYAGTLEKKKSTVITIRERLVFAICTSLLGLFMGGASPKTGLTAALAGLGPD